MTTNEVVAVPSRASASRSEIDYSRRVHTRADVGWIMPPSDRYAVGASFPVRVWWHVDKRRDETQQSLLFWAISTVEKRAELDVRESAARGTVRLVDDECSSVLRLAAKIPAVPIRAAIELSPLRHNCSISVFIMFTRVAIKSFFLLVSSRIRQPQAIRCVFNPSPTHGLSCRLLYLFSRKRVDLYPFLEFFLIEWP